MEISLLFLLEIRRYIRGSESLVTPFFDGIARNFRASRTSSTFPLRIGYKPWAAFLSFLP